MARRLILLGAIVVAAGAAIAVAVWPRGGEPVLIPGVHPTRSAPLLRDGSGVTLVPGMTKWISDRSPVCQFGKGIAKEAQLPSWCREVEATGSLFQQWTANRKSPDSSAGASVIVLRLETHQQAELLLHTPGYTGIDAHDFTPLPQAAVNGGIAGQREVLPGMRQLRFEWVAGSHIVEVNVWRPGGRLRVDEAESIARLTQPA